MINRKIMALLVAAGLITSSGFAAARGDSTQLKDQFMRAQAVVQQAGQTHLIWRDSYDFE